MLRSVREALHPDNLLCYDMNGEPLPPEHGFPTPPATENFRERLMLYRAGLASPAYAESKKDSCGGQGVSHRDKVSRSICRRLVSAAGNPQREDANTVNRRSTAWRNVSASLSLNCTSRRDMSSCSYAVQNAFINPPAECALWPISMWPISCAKIWPRIALGSERLSKIGISLSK